MEIQTSKLGDKEDRVNEMRQDKEDIVYRE